MTTMQTQVSAMAVAPVVEAGNVFYKGVALIAAQVMAFLGLVFLLHSVSPSIGGIGLFFEIMGMAFAGMLAAVICYQVVEKLPIFIKK